MIQTTATALSSINYILLRFSIYPPEGNLRAGQRVYGDVEDEDGMELAETDEIADGLVAPVFGGRSGASIVVVVVVVVVGVGVGVGVDVRVAVVCCQGHWCIISRYCNSNWAYAFWLGRPQRISE